MRKETVSGSPHCRRHPPRPRWQVQRRIRRFCPGEWDQDHQAARAVAQPQRLRHLRYVLKQYVEYFMKRRPHQGLKQQLPDSREESAASGRIRCRQVLGGLINDYYREAA